MNSLSGGTGSISTQISNVIASLDSNSNTNTLTGSPSVSYTLSAFEQEDGVVKATFSPIEISESQVTNLTTDLAAKAPLNSPELTGTPTAPTATVGTNSTQVATTAFVKNAIDTATAGLTGAMHFIGITSTEITDGATTNTLVAKSTGSLSKTTGFENGDVVLYDNDITIGKEFVWTGSAWELLGDEGSYAFNTITVTGTNGLTGGGNLQTNRTIEHAVPTGASAGTLGSASDNGGRKYIQTLTTDTYGHVTGATYAAETVTDTTYTFTTGDNDGQIKVTPSTNGIAGTAVNVTPKNLKTIATSANAYDLNQVNTSTSGNSQSDNKFFILDCGDASHFIDNPSTT